MLVIWKLLFEGVVAAPNLRTLSLQLKEDRIVELAEQQSRMFLDALKEREVS
jgi:hypothetical protein